jgi:hypothetical protein
MTLDRNPGAFRPKIVHMRYGAARGATSLRTMCVQEPNSDYKCETSSKYATCSSNSMQVLNNDPARHDKGCHCKKSNCLKKYCECFQANIYCFSKCRCHVRDRYSSHIVRNLCKQLQDCKNYPGSTARDCIAIPPVVSLQV